MYDMEIAGWDDGARELGDDCEPPFAVTTILIAAAVLAPKSGTFFAHLPQIAIQDGVVSVDGARVS
ncbi:MAG: hypothetical protein R6U92_03355 [Bacillota bacterium]